MPIEALRASSTATPHAQNGRPYCGLTGKLRAASSPSPFRQRQLASLRAHGGQSPPAKYHRQVSMSLAANTKPGPSADSRADEDRLDRLAINTIRTLAVDAVQKANSGHAGTPMAMAAVAYTLWQQFLRYDPRIRTGPTAIASCSPAGHASMLLYALLHLAGVRRSSRHEYGTTGSQPRRHQAISPDRQPHAGPSGISTLTTGVETTTGPLGQGCGNSVGMAMAEPLARGAGSTGRTRRCSITTST